MGRLHISEVEVPATRDVFGLVAFVVLCFGTSTLGGMVARPAFAEWYTELVKPPWTPPGWVFGPVWTILYALMAVAGWTVWREARSKVAVLLFLLQLAVNGAWPWVFFGQRRPDWAFYVIVALTLLVVATIVAFYRVRRRAAMLLVPYLAWVVFAGSLSFAVWRLNLP